MPGGKPWFCNALYNVQQSWKEESGNSLDKYCKILAPKKVELKFQVVLNRFCVSRYA